MGSTNAYRTSGQSYRYEHQIARPLAVRDMAVRVWLLLARVCVVGAKAKAPSMHGPALAPRPKRCTATLSSVHCTLASRGAPLLVFPQFLFVAFLLVPGGACHIGAMTLPAASLRACMAHTSVVPADHGWLDMCLSVLGCPGHYCVVWRQGQLPLMEAWYALGWATP